MKKNLISVLILALLIVNIVLTTIMMISVTGTSRKTTALVTDIAKILHLELGDTETEEETVIPMKNVETYDLEGSFTVPLKKGADGKEHYWIGSVSLAMNKKDKGYKAYADTMAEKSGLIRGEIIEVIGSHTLEEVTEDMESIKEEILQKIQTMYDSEFIFKVAVSDVMYQ